MEEYIINLENSQVYLDGPTYLLQTEKGIVYYREGTWYEKDALTGEFEPDFTVTWFYQDQNHPENYLYWESDTAASAVYNLTRALNTNAPIHTYMLNEARLYTLSAAEYGIIVSMIKSQKHITSLIDFMIRREVIIPAEEVEESMIA